MFDIPRVELTNFRSYRGHHVFELPTMFGLYQLTGINKDSPALGSNGSGKSSLLDAIYWSLYGRTTRGLKAGDVINWDAKQCRVVIHLVVGGTPGEVIRAQNPNSLTLNGTITSQEALEKYLRLGPEAFLYSVILPQFGESFFDLSPANKLALFSDIMGLDYWLDRSQAADLQAKEMENERVKAELQAAKIQGQCETTKSDLAPLRDKETNFAQTQDALFKRLRADLIECTADIKFNEDEIAACRKAISGAEAKIAKLVPKSTCPTCKQGIPNDDLKAISRNKADFEGKLEKVKGAKVKAEYKQASLQIAMAEEANRLNPYAGMIADKKQALVRLKEQLAALGTKINSLNEEHAAVSFWVGGFKRVRLFLIEGALQQLEIEVNNNLASLGLMDWKIGFDVERENKGGGITKGFVVLIWPPEAEEPIRYESYSGGETQRLRLAGDLGLANLIMERAGLSNTIEWYDEPSQHLSQEGLLDLAETLSQRAVTQGKRIFLVDHHVVDFSGFVDTICVIKDENGSRLTDHTR